MIVPRRPAPPYPSAVPPLLRRMLLSAWAWCVVGAVLGLAALAAREGVFPRAAYGLRTAHVHVLLVGFALQWIAAIAYWLYPGRRDAVDGTVAEVFYWLVNIGTLLRFAGEAAGVRGAVPLLGGTLQAAAVVLFVLGIAVRRLSFPYRSGALR